MSDVLKGNNESLTKRQRQNKPRLDFTRLIFPLLGIALVMSICLSLFSPNKVAEAAIAGGVVTRAEATRALNVFSTAVFGTTYPYTDTGAAAAWIIGGANLPPNDKNLLKVRAGAAAVAAYGKLEKGLEVALIGFEGVVTNDAAADLAAGGLGEITLGGFAAPANQDQALSYVGQVAPRLGNLDWKVKTTSNGNYVFYTSGQLVIQTDHGPVTTRAGAVATVATGSQGNTVVSIEVGTGTQASLVK